MFECLTTERLRAITSHVEGVDFSKVDAAVRNDADFCDEVHKTAMQISACARLLPQESLCPSCMILINGIIWGIRLERAFNEERALEAVVRVEG